MHTADADGSIASQTAGSLQEDMHSASLIIPKPGRVGYGNAGNGQNDGAASEGKVICDGLKFTRDRRQDEFADLSVKKQAIQTGWGCLAYFVGAPIIVYFAFDEYVWVYD